MIQSLYFNVHAIEGDFDTECFELQCLRGVLAKDWVRVVDMNQNATLG
jgi:hypothetical protein